MKPLRAHLALSTIVVACCLSQPLSAATFTWDTAASDSVVTGGAGTWDAGISGTANWTQDAGATNVTWPDTGTDNDAVFGGTAGAVTVATGGVSANDLTFNTAGYSVGGASITLNGATNIITATANSGTPITISSSLVGTSGFTKTGSGQLLLSGDNTGLSGTITLPNVSGTNNAGLVLSGSNSIGGITQVDVGGTTGTSGQYLGLNGVTLGVGVTLNLSGQGGNSAPVGTLRGTAGSSVVSGPVNIQTGNVRISNSGTSLTVNGAVTSAVGSGFGVLVRFGAGQGVTFSNSANYWEGTTILGEGSLYCFPTALPVTSGLSIGTSNSADFGTSGSFTRALGTAAGQVQLGRSNDGQRANGFSARGGALNLNLGGAAGDLVFLNTFSRTAATTNASAALTITDTSNLAVGMSVTGTGIPVDTLISSISGTTVTLNKVATATNASVSLTFFAEANPARINSSVLVLNGANADSALTLQNPLDLNGSNRTIQTSANTVTLAGGLKNSSVTAAALRKTGAGSLVYDPGSSYTLSLAGLNVSGGTLRLRSGTYTVTGTAGTSAPAGATGFMVATGGTIQLEGASVIASGGSFVFPAGNTAGGNSSFILDSGSFDAGTREALNAYGANGTTTINGGTFTCGTFRVNQGTGVLNLNGGTLRTNNLSTGGGTGTVNFNGGTLQAKITSATFVPTTLTNTVVQAGGAIIDSNGFNVTIAKALTEDSGSTGGGLTKLGAGNLTLSAANAYTGATTVNAGVLEFASGGLGTTGPVTFAGSSTLRWLTGNTDSLGSRAITASTGFTGTLDTGSNVVTLTAPIGGAGGIGKAGSGILKLDGANTFTGGITIGSGDNGWIEVDNAADLGTGTKTANLSSSTGSSVGGFRLLGGVSVSGVAINLGGRNTNAATQHAILNVSGDNTWGGNINITNSGGTYYLRSDSGRLELSGTLSNAQPANLTSDTRAFNLEGAGDFLISGTLANGINANRFTALEMNGTGTTTLTGTNTYTGSTTVDAGKLLINGNNSAATGAVAVNGTATLGGTGSIGGAITVAATATLDPGVTTGTLTAASVTGPVTDSGKLAVQVNGSSADKLVVTGALNISNLNLDITTPGSGATLPVYVLASYGTLTGSAFTSVIGLPSGYTLNYAYNDGVSSNNIALVATVTSTPYSTWAGTTYSLIGGDALPEADPDGDGVKNIVEFALNGNPTSGSNNGLSTTLIQDASAPAGNELTYTLAVRDGATFTSGAGGSQTTTVDGVIYTIQGSVDLSGFTSPVSVIGSASDTAPGLPSLAGTSWEYRTFKLDASEGLGGKGFLRVKIETAP